MSAPHILPIRIYWEDTDAGGIVYHASYLRFMERGRTELLRAAGVGQSELQAESGITFVVRRMTIDFRSPARLDDMIEVRTAVSAIGGASLTLDQSVVRGADVLAAAEVSCAVLGPAGRPVRLPGEVKARLTAD
ncbi:tol-pal system-associated acyl-CoA thioesterase [Terrihabitans sp. B22-R8]|uniref:tol-pal system-associated acyl-CoA thioesterase n=1 Tax=Terrihabitans sp. B22-R8 TaxID=3425128 RepID=UPI00403C6DC2